jgi:predicted permease
VLAPPELPEQSAGALLFILITTHYAPICIIIKSMEDLLYSLNAIVPLLVTMAVGWVIGLRGHAGESDINFLNRLAFQYLLPIHLFNTTMQIHFFDEFNPKLITFCALAIFFTMAAAWIVFAFVIKDRHRRCIFIVSTFRSNNVIYALPLSANLFGAEGTRTAAMLVPASIVLFSLFSVIVMVYHVQNANTTIWKSIKKTLVEIVKNPLMIGSVSGILFSFTNITMPLSLSRGIGYVAATATPIALILLGAQIDIKKLKTNLKPAFAACSLRLIVVPAIVIPLMVFCGFRGAELGVLMICFSAPCAVSSMVMARNYKIDPPFAAQVVYLSTAFSLATMFCIISILKRMDLF